jgi:hypothetical protein
MFHDIIVYLCPSPDLDEYQGSKNETSRHVVCVSCVQFGTIHIYLHGREEFEMYCRDLQEVTTDHLDVVFFLKSELGRDCQKACGSHSPTAGVLHPAPMCQHVQPTDC